MKQKIFLSYLMILTLILGCILVPGRAGAGENEGMKEDVAEKQSMKRDWIPDSDEEEYEYSKENATIWKTYSGSVNGVERTLVAVIFKDGTTSQYIRIGDSESNLLWYGNLDVGIDQYGAVWVLTPEHEILWWSYDLEPTFEDIFSAMGFYIVPIPGSTEIIDYVDDVESFEFEGTGTQAILTGYKTFSGEIYSLPSFDKMKEIAEIEEPIPEPLYIPKGMESLITPRPTTPTPVPPTPTPNTSEPSIPTQTPDVSESSKPTSTPDTPVSATPSLTPDMPVIETPAPVSAAPTPKVSSKKVSIKTKKKAKVLYEGNEFIGQYSLKKGVLTWKSPKKKGKMKGVKQAGFNKKTKKLVILTKKGDGYVLSFKNGKKKRVVRKRGRSFIYSGKFVTKIKTVSGKIDLSIK